VVELAMGQCADRSAGYYGSGTVGKPHEKSETPYSGALGGSSMNSCRKGRFWDEGILPTSW
jgi:hypothetical protein